MNQTSNRQGKGKVDKRGRAERVEGMNLKVVEMKVVVVPDQAKASAPLPVLVESEMTHPLDPYLNS